MKLVHQSECSNCVLLTLAMGKKTLLPLTFCLVLLLSVPIGASATGARAEDLVKADWSVNAARNLASNLPSLDAVQNFYDRANGDDAPWVKVCEFRFADLRNSGNLSLILTVEPGSWGCTVLDIFDKTPTGFEVYAGGAYGQDLANSLLDMGDNGRHELLLGADLAPYATGAVFGRLGCKAEWPLIFAWTGSTYSDVSDQYKDYYRGYLKSVNARLAAYSSVLAPAATPTANAAPHIDSARIPGRFVESSPEGGREGRGYIGPAPVTPAPPPEDAIPEWAARNQARRNYPCTRIEAAKTEAFLGIHSDSAMSGAIKDSESDDPNKRIAAAVVFSYLGTQEAEQDLKTLSSSDADSRVAALAKSAASFGEDPPPNARRVRREDTYLKLTEPRRSKH
jgi:hypothetical protein